MKAPPNQRRGPGIRLTFGLACGLYVLSVIFIANGLDLHYAGSYPAIRLLLIRYEITAWYLAGLTTFGFGTVMLGLDQIVKVLNEMRNASRSVKCDSAILAEPIDND